MGENELNQTKNQIITKMIRNSKKYTKEYAMSVLRTFNIHFSH